MENLSLDDILEKILNREISIRQASRISAYSRDFIREELNRRYANDTEKLEQIAKIMEENKNKASTIDIDYEKLKSIFFKVVNNEISIDEARKELGNIDIQTMKERFAEIALNLDSKELLEKYVRFTSKKEIDNSKINFRIIAIQMIRENLTQTEMAVRLGLQPRALSREFEKLSSDEDTRLYDLLKYYSFKKMQRHKFTIAEMQKLDYLLDMYLKDNRLLVNEGTTQSSTVEHKRYLASEYEKLKKQGLTQKEIAEKLDTSISSLRRARISESNRSKINDKMAKLQEDAEEVK